MLILPATIQLVHAFEQHEQTICTSEIENHLHQDDLECALCHLQAQNNNVSFTNDSEVTPTSFYQDYQDIQPEIVLQVFLFKKSSRGPPYFTL